MAEAVKIPVEARDPAKNKGTGSRFSRRLRAAGRIPAIVYGHKEPAKPISLPRDSFWEMIKKGTHLAELTLDGKSETVLVKDVQWDHLGKEVIHVDFARVSAGEAIHTQVKLELKGDAPGVAEGGLLEMVLHSIDLKCKADAIPDSIKVDISGLHLGKSIHARELQLPAGVALNVDPEVVVVHIASRSSAVETTTEGEAVQPEVIKPERKEKES
ncbi:MAG: 50S ribosomal protein L25 [Isosphaeraceae bacterium]|nr:50S ribosomal protein L25 [Isosphaeraceae bacterium]